VLVSSNNVDIHARGIELTGLAYNRSKGDTDDGTCLNMSSVIPKLPRVIPEPVYPVNASGVGVERYLKGAVARQSRILAATYAVVKWRNVEDYSFT
jgi:hypothetical protein